MIKNLYDFHPERPCEQHSALLVKDYIVNHVCNANETVSNVKVECDSIHLPDGEEGPPDLLFKIESKDGSVKLVDVEAKSAKTDATDVEFNFSFAQCKTDESKLFILMLKGKTGIDVAFICWFDIEDLIERKFFTKQAKGFRYRFNATKLIYFPAGFFIRTEGKTVREKQVIHILKVYTKEEIKKIVETERNKFETATKLSFSDLPSIIAKRNSRYSR